MDLIENGELSEGLLWGNLSDPKDSFGKDSFGHN